MTVAAGIRRVKAGLDERGRWLMRASHRSKMRSFRRRKRELFRNHELYSSVTRTPATPGNALASAVKAARIHTTTPANSGVIFLSRENKDPGGPDRLRGQ
jgi:hypothetical protein